MSVKNQTFRLYLKAKPNFMSSDSEAPGNSRDAGGFGKDGEERVSRGM